MDLILWISLSIATGIYSGRKGRSGLAFFLISLILSPLVGFIFAYIARPNNSYIEQDMIKKRGYKKCAACAELIKKEASVCRYCTIDFEPEIQ